MAGLTMLENITDPNVSGEDFSYLVALERAYIGEGSRHFNNQCKNFYNRIYPDALNTEVPISIKNILSFEYIPKNSDKGAIITSPIKMKDGYFSFVVNKGVFPYCARVAANGSLPRLFTDYQRNNVDDSDAAKQILYNLKRPKSERKYYISFEGEYFSFNEHFDSSSYIQINYDVNIDDIQVLYIKKADEFNLTKREVEVKPLQITLSERYGFILIQLVSVFLLVHIVSLIRKVCEQGKISDFNSWFLTGWLVELDFSLGSFGEYLSFYSRLFESLFSLALFALVMSAPIIIGHLTVERYGNDVNDFELMGNSRLLLLMSYMVVLAGVLTVSNTYFRIYTGAVDD